MKDPYKFVKHGPWVPLKGSGKLKCQRCGLVKLRNKFTQWSIDKGCFSEDHPQYEAQRRKAFNDR